MGKSALLIIDVQFGMYNGERIVPIFQGEQKINKIEHLIKEARNNGTDLIYIQHEGDKGHPLEKDTKGWMIHPKILPLAGELVIGKKHPDAFLNTELHTVLTKLSISSLYIVGNQTDQCVDATCRSAFAKGFRVLLVKDCHSTWSTEALSALQIINHHNETLGNGYALVKEYKEISFREFENL